MRQRSIEDDHDYMFMTMSLDINVVISTVPAEVLIRQT